MINTTLGLPGGDCWVPVVENVISSNAAAANPACDRWSFIVGVLVIVLVIAVPAVAGLFRNAVGIDHGGHFAARSRVRFVLFGGFGRRCFGFCRCGSLLGAARALGYDSDRGWDRRLMLSSLRAVAHCLLGQGETKCRSLADFALRAGLTAHHFHELANNGEAQAGTAETTRGR